MSESKPMQPTGAARWRRGTILIELTDEPRFTPGSADNVRQGARELFFVGPREATSIHAVSCFDRARPIATVVLGAGGGATGVHERSCVVLADRCIVAVGDRLAALSLPDLELEWSVRADEATCFGLHASTGDETLIVHGELAISKYTARGEKVWEFLGADIFTGDLSLGEDTVHVSDFESRRYTVDLEHGVRRTDPSS